MAYSTERSSETRHHAVAAYGLESKKDLVNAIRKYCQYVEACGKGPVRYARCDATSMVSRVDGDWTEEFAAACAELSSSSPLRPRGPAHQQRGEELADPVTQDVCNDAQPR
jgi:hypothetical protein